MAKTIIKRQALECMILCIKYNINSTKKSAKKNHKLPG